MSISTGRELRQAYLDYFRAIPTHPHPIVSSSPVVPPDDPTLLFTTAGMVQFKSLYSGLVDPLPYPRAATVQKCLRAGGKGSDLENVGKTLRHHTFFEMLGNFSFGDYFKRETIRFAWEFCTSPQWMNLPKDRMFPTIYGPTPDKIDTEAMLYYAEETDCPNPLIPLDESENFWGPAGDTGACGPCSEVKFFLGTDAELAAIRAELRTGGPDALKRLGQRVIDEGDTFLEIWNMVFPQYDQQRDGSRPLLKHKGIDTGAGLERMTVALRFAQSGVPSTPYETDLMWPIVEAASNTLGIPYLKVSEKHSAEAAKERLAINAIADHTRALVFTLAEGITPSNVGRGYVLRRIQRRALRFASLLGVDKPFMATLYDAVVDTMGDAYPEIAKNPDFIRKALRREEETFLQTRDRGMKILEDLMTQAEERGEKSLSGEEAFRLWDTYGFPVDLTLEIAGDDGLSVDMDGYKSAMTRQKEEARKSWKGAKLDLAADLLDELHERNGSTEFLGYEGTGPVETDIIGFIHKGSFSDTMRAGEEGLLVLRATPFYAEGGGQVGDTGIIESGSGRFEVTDCQKTPHGIFIHKGRLIEGHLNAGDKASARVDEGRRNAIRRNHSSVHLLQSALKRLLGEHVTQAGSYVSATSSRFDFTHTEAVSAEQLLEIQREVNRLVMASQPVVTEVLSLEEAKKKGAIAPFGEKYGAVVRVISMGPDSIEFCGGTHVRNTGDIMHYRLVSECSIASGIRRIEAVTGVEAEEQELDEHFHVVVPLETALAVKGAAVVERVALLQARVKDLEREVARLRQEAALRDVSRLAQQARDLGGKARLCVVRMDGLESADLRAVVLAIRDSLGDSGVAAVLSANGDKVALAVATGKNAQADYPAGQVLNKLAAPLGGKGGGKPDFAQGGAREVSKIDEVVAGADALIG